MGVIDTFLHYFRDIPSVPKLGRLDEFIEDFAIEAFQETIIKKLEQYGKSI